PQDDSNRPVAHYQQNPIVYWPIYPQFLRDYFTRAFTQGIHDPKNGRVRESEWRMAFVQLGDSIIYCPGCGAENFYDAESVKNAKPIVCWNCNRSVPLPMRLRLDGNVIMLNHDTKIYPHHLDDLYNFSKPVAEVAQNPSNPAQWGLRNLSEKIWTATFRDGRMVEVQPGKAVSLDDQMKVNFGGKEGEIRLGR
ncbi:MAG: serine/threonine protein kinase, partial [Bellilinea sp.]